MHFTTKSFHELTPDELYAILQLRSEVFVVEQNCVFLDMDGKDQKCYHIMAWKEKKLMACARIVPAGISYVESSIGRIVSSPSARKEGIGKLLVKHSIDTLFTLYGHVDIRIGAQYYLRKFYESFGFTQDSGIYLEDGIEHIQMVLLSQS